MGTSTIALKALAGNPPTSLNPLQLVLLPHADALTAFWFSLWCMTAIVLLWQVVREYLRGHSDS